MDTAVLVVGSIVFVLGLIATVRGTGTATDDAEVSLGPAREETEHNSGPDAEDEPDDRCLCSNWGWGKAEAHLPSIQPSWGQR